MILLENGCKCSEIKVMPKRWKALNASTKKPWIIYYRFYDPLFRDKYPEGKQVRLREMNEFTDLADRQKVTAELIANELRLLKECQYNPITGQHIDAKQRTDYIIDPTMGLSDALQAAFDRKNYNGATKIDIKGVLKFFKNATDKLRISDMAVKDIKRRHIIAALDQCKKDKKVFTAATFNAYKKYISALFSELVRVEAIENNPVIGIESQKKTIKIKQLLTDEEAYEINEVLKIENYTFWRLINIFYHSGARTTELFNLKKENVDIDNQIVIYTIEKDKAIRQAKRPIKDIVLPLWQELISMAKDGDYIFSNGLVPGAVKLYPGRAKKLWTYWVQVRMNIDKTWYSLKHKNSDEMDALYGSAIAARLNEHSKEVLLGHYAVNNKSREHEVIKKAGNSFAMEKKKPAQE